MKSLMKSNASLFPAIPSLLDEFFTKDWLDSSLGSWRTVGSTQPAVNVMETNDELLIDVAAPGMKRDDFKVELDNDLLTVSSEQRVSHEEKDQENIYTLREFNYYSFQ